MGVRDQRDPRGAHPDSLSGETRGESGRDVYALALHFDTLCAKKRSRDRREWNLWSEPILDAVRPPDPPTTGFRGVHSRGLGRTVTPPD